MTDPAPQTTHDRLAAMSDAQLTSFFQFWATRLVDGRQTDLDTITAGIPRELKTSPSFRDVTDINTDRELDAGPSAEVARTVLMPLADDPQVEPSITAALDQYDDDKMFVGTILAVGLVASVLLIVATTEFEGTIGSVKFHKGKADPEMLKAITEGLTGLLNPFTGG